MEWMQIVPYIFGFMAVSILGWFASSIKELNITARGIRDEMSEMNTSLAVIISRVDSHEHRISRLEDRDV